MKWHESREAFEWDEGLFSRPQYMGLLDYFGFLSEGTTNGAAGAIAKGLGKFRDIVSVPLKWIGRKATQARLSGSSNPAVRVASELHSAYNPEQFYGQVEQQYPDLVITSLPKRKQS